MSKEFINSFCGSLAAIWATIILFVLMFVSTMIGLVVAFSGDKESHEGSILHIELAGAIPDREADLKIADLINGADLAESALDDILNAVRLAADDKKIKGIFLDCQGSQLGIASRMELNEALSRFSESGKWIYAYADTYTQGDYFVATAADSLLLNPVGMVEVCGLSAMVMFYKDLLDKVGIDVTVVRVGDFKSAVEPFMRMDMSEASRLQMEEYLGSVWNSITENAAEQRHIDTANINRWADDMIFTWPAEACVEARAVDALKYRDEAENMMRDLVDIDIDDDMPYVTPAEYMVGKADKLGKADKKHIAVLYAVGDIVDSGNGGIVGETMAPEIIDLANNDKVKGLVLRVNSGGGSAFASEQIWHALEVFKQTGKPFYVSMGDYAASGGYYISCGADTIFADATTLTGSIGIFGLIPNAHKLLTEKIGLGIESVSTSPNAGFPSPYKAPTQEQYDAMQRFIEHGYDTFTSRVAQGRSLPQDSVKAIGGGRIWTGLAALQIGLVDRIGSLNDAVTAMAETLDLKSTDFVAYPRSEEKLLNTLLREIANSEALAPDPIAARFAEFRDRASTLFSTAPIQARLPLILIK